MAKKKILMISSEYPNVKKSSNIYTDLAEALELDGHSITVVVAEESKNVEKTEISMENNIRVLRVKVGNLYNVGLLEKGITFLKSGFLIKQAMSKFFKNESFDLILFMSQPVTISNTVKWAMKKYACLSYLMMKDIFPQNGVDIGIISKRSLVYWYFRMQERRLYKTATKIGCMSEMNKKYLLENNSYLTDEKMDIFPNTQKIEKLKEKSTEYKFRKKYGISTNKVLAVYGGNLGKPQGVSFFAEVLKSYKNDSNLEFLILARGTEKEYLYKFVDDNMIKNVHKFDLLPREDYQNILLECDIGLIFLDNRFTIPNYPSKALAYFNLGIPIMAGIDINNDFKDMLIESNSGFWAESGNIKEYREKLNCLIYDENLREQMGIAGREYLEKYFSVENSVKIINNYLNEICRKEDSNV